MDYFKDLLKVFRTKSDPNDDKISKQNFSDLYRPGSPKLHCSLLFVYCLHLIDYRVLKDYNKYRHCCFSLIMSPTYYGKKILLNYFLDTKWFRFNRKDNKTIIFAEEFIIGYMCSHQYANIYNRLPMVSQGKEYFVVWLKTRTNVFKRVNALISASYFTLSSFINTTDIFITWSLKISFSVISNYIGILFMYIVGDANYFFEITDNQTKNNVFDNLSKNNILHKAHSNIIIDDNEYDTIHNKVYTRLPIKPMKLWKLTSNFVIFNSIALLTLDYFNLI